VILDFTNNAEPDYYYEEGSEGQLAGLIPLRTDLMAEDLRCLYLAWLMAVQNGDVVDEVEPPLPPGLGSLSGTLEAFVDFLRIDPGLIEVAASLSPEAPIDEPSRTEMSEWVARLPDADKNQLLLQLLQDEPVFAARALRQRFRKERTKADRGGPEAPASPRRTAGELRAAWEGLVQENERKKEEAAARERQRQAQEKAAARARHLDALEGREEELWRQVEEGINARLPKEYDRAVNLFTDLRDLAERCGDLEEVAARIRRLREQHRNKRTLLQRLNKRALSG
jgi:hypothetical protein